MKNNTNNKFKGLEIFDLTKLTKISKVSYSKLYFRKTGQTKEPMELMDATRVINALQKQLEPVMSAMGFRMIIERKDQ